MADSNITKKALAAALKDLMTKMPFSKISVGDICELCQMNRKSFYYHFKDKYDLVNWMFYTEFVVFVREKENKDPYDLLLNICTYFENNKKFYRKIIKYDGQNSFFNYFYELLMPAIQGVVSDLFTDDENKNFFMTFFAESFIMAIKRWLTTSIMPADKFVSLLQSTIYGAADNISKRNN